MFIFHITNPSLRDRVAFNVFNLRLYIYTHTHKRTIACVYYSLLKEEKKHTPKLTVKWANDIHMRGLIRKYYIEKFLLLLPLPCSVYRPLKQTTRSTFSNKKPYSLLGVILSNTVQLAAPQITATMAHTAIFPSVSIHSIYTKWQDVLFPHYLLIGKKNWCE